MRSVLVLTTLVVASLTISACAWLLDTVETRSTETRSFALSDPAALEFSLSNVNGWVDMVGELGRSSVDVEIEKIAHGPTSPEAKKRLQEITIIVEQQGDAISIRTELPKFRFFWASLDVHYTVRVPQSFKRTKINSVNGRVEAQQISASEQVSLETVNGRIEFRGAAPQIELSSVNGRVELSAQGSAKIQTVNGSIRGELAEGAIDASTTNGSVQLALSDVRRGEIGTTNGGIRLTLRRAENLEVIATSDNGRVELSGFDAVEKTKHRARGLLGQGNQLLRLATANGGIQVQAERDTDLH